MPNSLVATAVRNTCPLPLYTEADAELALRRLQPLPFEQVIDVVEGMQVRPRRAGHILGASSIELTAGGTTVLFSGDLGRPNDLIMREPEPIEHADYIVTEM